MAEGKTEKETGSIETLLRERIAREGRITYETFVETVLFDERFGYYRDGKREGKDYFTSPEIHGAFGRTIGRYIDALRAGLGDAAFAIIELGGASGKLARDVLASLSSPPERYLIVEKGVERKVGPVRWVNGVDRIEPLDCFTVVLANEFFDALPFHRIINTDGVIREIYVGYENGFTEEAGPLCEGVASFLERYPVILPPGRVTEVTTYALPVIQRLSVLVQRGCFIVFDYGYHHAEIADGRFPDGSVMAYRSGSTRAGIFENLGDTDITHHVDFDHLTLMQEDCGWKKEGETEQYRFLFNAGIIDEFSRLSPVERLSAKWLINPEGLGSMISTLGFSKGLPMRLPGFGKRP